jgi:hypothetical protein
VREPELAAVIKKIGRNNLPSLQMAGQRRKKVISNSVPFGQLGTPDKDQVSENLLNFIKEQGTYDYHACCTSFGCEARV